MREAIEHIGADRLGHGVRIVQDSSVVRIARERAIAFEVCVTSNLQSGSIKHLEQHPLKKLHHLSLLTTINTDDPSVSDITLTDELVVVTNHLGLTLDDVKTNILNAVQVAFLPDAVKVGGKQIAFDDVLYLYADPSSDRPPCPNSVCLKNGEIWAGEIVSGSSKKISSSISI